ncbi:hypothetical protein BDB00DRAFT_926705 [Zychaea mexicana]|uniref:uncharacterized protein n=1 Tax=Zychaea mexicana TaxID=64656 RepID=UPI0022FF09BF|nr:uncharacterized protein BDB00DRAFT_926705 [Zychaea mexicana]KAI9496490.1 hypothetical protein BDB00DRAFT_926705 [Zychaea mexicana]
MNTTTTTTAATATHNTYYMLDDDETLLIPRTPPPPYSKRAATLHAKPTFWSPRTPPQQDGWLTMRGTRLVKSIARQAASRHTTSSTTEYNATRTTAPMDTEHIAGTITMATRTTTTTAPSSQQRRRDFSILTPRLGHVTHHHHHRDNSKCTIM